MSTPSNAPAWNVTISPREHATILAALRYYQTVHLVGRAEPDDDDHNEMIENISTNGGSYSALDLDEIDELIEETLENASS